MDGEDPLSHPLSALGPEIDDDASFYRFAVSCCGAPSHAQPRRGAWRVLPRGRTSLTQHFKLKHHAGRRLAERLIKRLLDDRNETKDRPR
jgi:hypothetical protein